MTTRYQVTMQLTVEVSATSISSARDEAVELIAVQLHAAEPSTSNPDTWHIDAMPEALTPLDKIRKALSRAAPTSGARE